MDSKGAVKMLSLGIGEKTWKTFAHALGNSFPGLLPYTEGQFSGLLSYTEGHHFDCSP
jgi:hypothetical protein